MKHSLTGAVVSLVNPTIVQNEGDGDMLFCARLDSPAGGTEKEIFITLNYQISSVGNSSSHDIPSLPFRFNSLIIHS